MSIFSFARKFFSKKDPETDTRSSAVFKTQVDPETGPLSPYEQGLADAYDALPRQCRRAVDRQEPDSWGDLYLYMRKHRASGHRPGGTACVR